MRYIFQVVRISLVSLVKDVSKISEILRAVVLKTKQIRIEKCTQSQVSQRNWSEQFFFSKEQFLKQTVDGNVEV